MVAGLVGAGLLLGGCASGRDSWWGRDKALHLSTAAAISGSVSYAALRTGDGHESAGFKGAGVVLVLGAGKEAYDSTEPGNAWSWKDMSWNVLGALLGVGIANALTEPDR